MDDCAALVLSSGDIELQSPIEKLPSELLLNIFEHSFDIDDCVQLGLSCKRLYALLEDRRMHLMRHIVTHSWIHRDDVALTRFLFANGRFAAQHLNTPLTGAGIHPDVLPSVASAWELMRGMHPCENPRLSDAEVMDIVVRWEALKVFKELYTTSTERYRSNPVKALEANHHVGMRIDETELAKWRDNYRKSCFMCVPCDQRWTCLVPAVEPELRLGCAHDMDEVRLTYHRASVAYAAYRLPYSRFYQALARSWMTQEIGRYYKCSRGTAEEKSNLMGYIHGECRTDLTVQDVLDVAEVSDFIRSYSLMDAEFVKGGNWKQRTMHGEADWFHGQGYNGDHSEVHFLDQVSTHLNPIDILELLTLKPANDAGDGLTFCHCEWPQEKKAAFLRRRGMFLDDVMLRDIVTTDGGWCAIQVHYDACDWTLQAERVLEAYLPVHHITVRWLWNDYASRHWNEHIRGHVLLRAPTDPACLAWLLQNSLLGGDATAPLSDHEISHRFQEHLHPELMDLVVY